MATVNVIVEARGRDKGARRQLRELTKQADALTESLRRASQAGQGFRLPPGVASAPRASGSRSSGTRARSEGGRPSSSPASGPSKQQREFERAIEAQIRDARAHQRAVDREHKAQERAARRQSKEQERAARAAGKSARNIENLTDAQLVEIETQREINRRRRRAAVAAARERVDQRMGRRRGDGRGNIELAENLSTVSGEFERVGDKVESGIRSSFGAFKDYEKGIVEITTITDKMSLEDIRQITTDATKQFGGQATAQVEALNAIIGAEDRLTKEEAQAQLEIANKLAIGGQASTEDAVNAISKAVANFKSQGVDAAEAADSIFQAYDRGAGSVEEFARALPNVAAAASAAGLTLDETNAALAVLSQRMPSVKEGSTSLKAALSNLQKPSKGAREEAKRLGIDFSVAGMRAAGGLEGFLLKIRAAEKFDENTLAKLFDSSEARSAIQNLIDGLEDYNSVLDDMANKEGAHDRAYSKMTETAAHKTEKLEGQIALLKIQAGEALLPALMDLTEWLGPVVEKVSEWIKDNPRWASGLGKAAIALVGVSRGLSAITSVMSMTKAVTGLTESMLGGFAGTAKLADKNSAGAAKSVKSIGGAMGGLNVVLLGAAAAIAAFEFVLDGAEDKLRDYEETIDKITKEQQEIKFKNEDGSEKTEEQIRLEQRNRLIEDVNAARKLEFEGSGAGAWSELKEGEILGAFGSAYGSLLNKATGVDDDFKRLREQAESALAAFDARYGEQLGLTEDQLFVREDEGLGRVVELLQKQIDATNQVAQNTNGPFWQGPVLDSGV